MKTLIKLIAKVYGVYALAAFNFFFLPWAFNARSTALNLLGSVSCVALAILLYIKIRDYLSEQ